MKILFTSYAFAPSIGGIETVASLLAPEFVRAGHEVKLVTKTSKADAVSRPFEVLRNPSPFEFLRATRWCDVFFQNNISVELAWPLLVFPRPWIVAHHTWIHLNLAWKVHSKLALLRLATNISISQWVADSLPVPSAILGNPFAPEVFQLWPGIARDRELVYLGRLVSDKGVDLLIDALADLRQRGLRPRLTIIGLGPELGALRERAQRLELEEQVEFTGSKTGLELARALNAHQVMVVPSRWVEPFGVVALEGVACGCLAVVSRNGGLPEAAGPCGITFETGNSTSLADALEKVLTQPHFREGLEEKAALHLAQFAPGVVAARYLQLFEQARHRKSRSSAQ